MQETVKTFERRNWTKAEIRVLPSGQSVLIKDYGRCNILVRLFGRFCLYTEAKALKRLEGVKGIPALHGRVGRYALAMEFIDASPLSELKKAGGVPPDFADRLAELFDAIESRGVAHGDPHFRNILCGSDGQPYLVDFAMSYVRGTLPLIGGWIFRNLQVSRQRRLQKLRQVFYNQDDGVEVKTSRFYRSVRPLRKALRHLRKNWRRK